MNGKEIIDSIIAMNDKASMSEKERSILVPASSFGTLRTDLIKNIGKEQSRAFLNRYGWASGQKDAKKILEKNFSSLNEIINYGPIIHTKNGHVKAKTVKLEVNKEQKGNSIHMEGIWKSSYEVVEHVKQFGKTDYPICYTLTGYASGYLSKVFEQMVVVKEVKCEAKGDDYCYWIGKSLNLWDEEEIEEGLNYFEQDVLTKELEETYDKLLEERDNLKRNFSIHKLLTEKLLVGNDLVAIADMFYNVTKIPGMIIDQTYSPLAYSDCSFQDVKGFSEELKCFLQMKGSNLLIETQKIKLADHDVLITPIYLKENIIGYCLFIYSDGCHINEEVEQSILEQVALISSLSLLVEKAKFDAERKIEGHFLEDILHGKYKEKEEIYRRGLFMDLDLSVPYRIITVQYELKQNNTQKKLSYNEDIIETTINYFKSKQEKIIIGHQDNNVLFLVTKNDLPCKKITPYFNHYLQFISKMFSKLSFVAGVSNLSPSITKAKEKYEQSLIASRMAVSNKQIIFFDSIGVIGPLLNENNKTEVIKISQSLLLHF